jgi:uncharacterized repeat protein (TIGR01451 family)/CSLREA domain-containing protein
MKTRYRATLLLVALILTATAAGFTTQAYAVTFNLQHALQQLNLRPTGPYTDSNGNPIQVFSSFGLQFVSNNASQIPADTNPNSTGTLGDPGTGYLAVYSVGANEVWPSDTVTQARLTGPAPIHYSLNCATLDYTGSDSLTAFTITRVGVNNGASTPAWKMSAYDASGTLLSSVSEGDINHGSFLFPSAPHDFTVSSTAIARVVFCNNNYLSTYDTVPLAGETSSSFTVNSTADMVDSTPGDGVCATSTGECTLRAAIQEANAFGGTNTITLPAGTYTLTLTGQDEDAAATGDLDITSDITINGAGASTTIIDANGIDRVFDVNATLGGDLTVSGVTIKGGNPNNSGGGINGGPVTLTNVIVTGNTTGLLGNGGGIRTYANQAVTLTDVTISGNSTLGAGGGVAIDHATLTNVTVSGNSACCRAGIAVGNATLTNVTVSGNTATTTSGGSGQGGGIGSDGTLSLTNVTVIDNSAPAGTGGGLQALPGSTFTLKNTIVADNIGGNCTGIITSSGHNLDSGTTCGFTNTGDLSNTNPKLAPLANNGGSTETSALCTAAGVPDASCTGASPAIDAGTNSGCPATDQRGVSRPLDGNGDCTLVCDIGAYEAPTATPQADLAVSKTANTTVKNHSNLTYTVTVTNGGPNAASAVVMTDPLPPGAGFFSATPSQGRCTTPKKNASGTVSCNLGSITSGASATVPIVVKVSASVGSTLSNTASVGACATDPNLNNNSATVTTTVTK